MKIAIALVASILSFAAADTQAASRVQIDTITVNYSDLDLDHTAGVSALYQRIRNAAQRVCDANQGQTLVQKHAYAACLEQAVTSAVARADLPALSDYVAQQTGKRVQGESARVASR